MFPGSFSDFFFNCSIFISLLGTFCLWLFVCSDFNLGGVVFLNCFLIDLSIGIYILVYALVTFSLL